MAIPGAVTVLDEIVSENVTYVVDGTRIEAYTARPRQPANYPGIIVIHEAFGPVEHINDVARRFANRGYSAIAPNLYSRVGTPEPGNMDSVFGKMFALPDSQIVRDLEGAAAYLRNGPQASGKVGVIGFCSGGRQSLLMTCQSTQVDAAIDCWGGFIRTASPTEATSPTRPVPVVDMVDNIHCPLFVVVGEEDQNPSPEDAKILEEKLAKAGKTFQVKVYHDAGHAFFADYRPNYREKAAFELWDDANAFLDKYLR